MNVVCSWVNQASYFAVVEHLEGYKMNELSFLRHV